MRSLRDRRLVRSGSLSAPRDPTRLTHVKTQSAYLLWSLILWLPPTVSAQEGGAWNAPRALELMSRATAARHQTQADSALRSYRAEARGYVYFLIDRPDTDELIPVKTDQIALEIYWRAPDLTRQRIVGLRDQKLLPTNIKYHLDHMTVVQDDFADRIRLGDGDEVSDVVHPAAPSADSVYDFRLADSLTLTFPGRIRDSVRVYEIQVRPKDVEAPGFIGNVFLDRATGGIARMNFTFTSASYVDPYLDYIRISLDNAFWDERYWLPYRQEAELRRELPQLDFLAGSIIRGRFEVGGYDFDVELPDAFFRSARVTTVPEQQRRAFPFERPLFADLEDDGLSPPPSLAEVRREAAQMVAERYLSGLDRLRLYLPSASHAFRHNRAEGMFIGMGAVFRPSSAGVLRAHVGYAFRTGHGALLLRGARDESTGTGAAEVFVNQLRDIGSLPGASGAISTLASLVAGDDYLDPYFATGVRLTLPDWRPGPQFRATLTIERHTSPPTTTDPSQRSLRPVREGMLTALDWRLAAGTSSDDGWSLSGDIRLAALDGERYWGLQAHGAWSRTAAWRRVDLGARADAGAVSTTAPQQELYLLGGRGTLLGHPYRRAVGNRYWLVRADASVGVAEPWLTARVFIAAGQAAMRGSALPTTWAGPRAQGVLSTVGTGLGIFWDVLRLDVGHGIETGDWRAALSVARRFQAWL